MTFCAVGASTGIDAAVSRRETFPRGHQNVWAEPQSLSEFGDENIY